MIQDFENIYHYDSIQDFLIDFHKADKVFNNYSDKDILESSTKEIITDLEVKAEINAVKKILDEFNNHFIVARDSASKIQVMELKTPEVKPLDYYMNPENFRRLRKELGYTQKEFGYQMGFDSIRRGHTILEKEKGRVKISPREARILRYLVTYGSLDQEEDKEEKD